MKPSLILMMFAGILMSAPASALEIYKVAKVTTGTSLNLRAWPSPQSRILVAVPHNASWLVKSGVSKKVGAAVWEKVRWNQSEGWVNGSYLALDPAASRMANERKQCLADPKEKNKICCGYPMSERQRPFQHIAILSIKGLAAGETLPLRSQPGRWKGNALVAIPHNASWIAKLEQQRKLPNGETWLHVRWSGIEGWVNSAYTEFDPRMTQQGDYKRKLCSVK